MNLLRYYFMVGGGDFDVEKFSLAALENGFEGGKSRITRTTKRLTYQNGSTIERKIFSGVTGTNGDSFTTWQTALVEYATDRDIYLADLGLTTETMQTWLREEAEILKFLNIISDRLPHVANYCQGSYFLLLKLIYGYGEEDGPGGGFHYSEVLMQKLCELKAGLSSDSESFEMHFNRIETIKKHNQEN